MISAGYGNYPERRISGYANTVLSAKHVYGRFAFSMRDQDGTVENLADGSSLNGKRTLAFRGALRWQPTTRTIVDVIGNWQRDTPPGTSFKSGVIPTRRGDTDPFLAAELNRGTALGVDRTVGGLTMIIDYSLNDAWSITSTAGGREFDSYEDFDADGAGIYVLEFADDSRGRQYSGEIRAITRGSAASTASLARAIITKRVRLACHSTRTSGNSGLSSRDRSGAR